MTDLLDLLPGWEPGSDTETPDWPEDMAAENPAWVAHDPLAPTDAEWDEYDRWAEAERDAQFEEQRREPWRYSIIACGTCHPELLSKDT